VPRLSARARAMGGCPPISAPDLNELETEEPKKDLDTISDHSSASSASNSSISTN